MIKRREERLTRGMWWEMNENKRKGKTVLHIAVKKGNIQMVSLLLEKGASISSKSSKGKLPIDIAKENNHLQIHSILSRSIFLLSLSFPIFPSPSLSFSFPLSSSITKIYFN